MLLVAALLLPRFVCDRGSQATYRGDMPAWRPLTRHVAQMALAGRTDLVFNTPHQVYDAEWLFGTYQLAALGLGQVILQHPEQRAELLPALHQCIETLLSPAVRAIHRRAWNEDPIDSLEHGAGQVGYLGYLNLALSMERLVEPNGPHAALNDRVTAAMVKRLQASRIALIPTYPGQSFPVDNCATVGSIGLYDRACGTDHRALIEGWSRECRRRYVEPRSGLLYQQVDPVDGLPVDRARASGTSLGLYFLTFADREFAGELYHALKRQCVRSVCGFGVVKEYAELVLVGGNVDSGPVLFGAGLTATAFTLACCRANGDEASFRAIYRTAWFLGAPLDRHGSREYVSGGPIGNALLLAGFTAEPGAAAP